MYLTGEIVGKDLSEAIRLYRLATAQGNALAPENLGNMYFIGEGVEKNLSEAARLYRLAADRGNTYAQDKLGCMYRDGVGVEKNEEEALRLFSLAAERGSRSAQLNFLDIIIKRNSEEAGGILGTIWDTVTGYCTIM